MLSPKFIKDTGVDGSNQSVQLVNLKTSVYQMIMGTSWHSSAEKGDTSNIKHS